MIIISFGKTGKKMLKDKLKRTGFFVLLKTIKNYIDNQKLEHHLRQYERKYSLNSFQFDAFKLNILHYISSNQGEGGGEYRFAGTCKQSDLYSSIYALMTLGILNEVGSLGVEAKENWAEYILSFQREDGMFVDPYLDSALAGKLHYWGWHHLLPHVIVGLAYLDAKPKYDFKFLFNMFEEETIEDWLESRAWTDNYLAVSNEIMNITVLLQYSRDVFDNSLADAYVKRILSWLSVNRIDKKSGLWGNKTSRSDIDMSMAVKTAYHFLPMYVYDNDLDALNIADIIDSTLRTQNDFGTYGPCYISDACEDIDSLYLLTQLPLNPTVRGRVDESVSTFFNSVFINMNEDGGFVFKRLQSFQYADSKLISAVNESNMFGTWFRVLSIAYACKHLGLNNDFQFSGVSGYQFYREYK